MYRGKNVNITEEELELLEVINKVGPCGSETVHEAIDKRQDYLFVMRRLHALVQKGFLQRIIINKKQFYRTSKAYSFIKGFLKQQ